MQVICGGVFSCFCFWDHLARYPRLALKLWSLCLCLCLLGLITGIHSHICLLSRPQRRSYLKLWNRWTGSNLQVLHLTAFFWSLGESHNHCLLVVLAPVLQHSSIWLHSKLSLLVMVTEVPESQTRHGGTKPNLVVSSAPSGTLSPPGFFPETVANNFLLVFVIGGSSSHLGFSIVNPIIRGTWRVGRNHIKEKCWLIDEEYWFSVQ